MTCFVCACCAATAIESPPTTSNAPSTIILFMVEPLEGRLKAAPTWQPSYLQVATENRYRVTGEQNAIVDERDAKHAAAGGSLERRKALFSQSGSPVGRQRAMRRACHRILIDAGAGREEP